MDHSDHTYAQICASRMPPFYARYLKGKRDKPALVNIMI